ncbi:MAG: TetR/AcrR family transcriptional regulator [Telluria sp.]
MTTPPSNKAADSLAAIVHAGLAIAREEGIGHVSFGKVAKRLGVSKSSVFCRTRSLQRLQAAVLDEYDRQFEADVVEPARTEPKGLPALDAHVRKLAARVAADDAAARCLYISGAFECAVAGTFLHERLQHGLARWRSLLRQSVRDALQRGQLRPDTNAEQLIFEIHSLVVGLVHDARFLRDPGIGSRMVNAYERLMAYYMRNGAHVQ